MRRGSHVGLENTTTLMAISFLGGVISSSFAWWLFLPVEDSSDDQEKGPAFQDLRSRLDKLLSRVLTGGDFGGFEEVKSMLLMELQQLRGVKRRTRWPWDRRRRQAKSHESEWKSSPNNSSSTKRTSKAENTRQSKSDLCIGSIFGLDVGGTLAKLVYFEQKQQSFTNELMFRDRSLRTSSAQVVALSGSRPDVAGLSTSQRFDKGFEAHHRHSLSASKLRRSRQSQDDIRALELLRQDSVPENLSLYTQAMQPNVWAPSQNSAEATGNSTSTAQSMRRSRSLLDLNRTRAQALENFYDFAKRLDSYRAGVRDDKLAFYSRELQGEFHFIHFETRRMPNAMELIRANNLHQNIQEMGATGGGAHKFAGEWERELGITMKKQGEMDSVVAGMQYVLATVVGECYTFRPPKTQFPNSSSVQSDISAITDESRKRSASTGGPCQADEGASESSNPGSSSVPTGGAVDEWWWSRKVRRDAISYASSYPYLLVTIGTGVSILRVDGPRKYERVSGSTIGGGTYWGLIRLLTDVEDFDEVLRLAARGDPSKVDMMVGDIYGKNSDALEKLGLPANLVASSFGKLVAKEDPAAGLKQEDLARALLLMITNNIGQVAYLNAKLAHTQRIYFVGNFLRQNTLSQRRLSYAIDFWSKGDMEALFLEHEGYLGALGAFLMSQGIPGCQPELDTPRTRASSTDSQPCDQTANNHRRTSTMGFL